MKAVCAKWDLSIFHETSHQILRPLKSKSRCLIETARSLENSARPLTLRAQKLCFYLLRLRHLEFNSRPLEIMQELCLGMPVHSRALEKILRHLENYSKTILKDFYFQSRRFNFYLNSTLCLSCFGQKALFLLIFESLRKIFSLRILTWWIFIDLFLKWFFNLNIRKDLHPLMKHMVKYSNSCWLTL